MAIITFPKILTDRLTDQGAKALADILDRVENSAQKTTIEIVEQRFERRLSQEIGSLETRLVRWMFMFWIGQLASVIAIFSIFLK